MVRAERTETGVKNPMVHEKTTPEPTKPQWESDLEEKTKNETKDTSHLVDKDTEKAKGVWQEKDKQDKQRQVSASSINENESFWGNMTGKTHAPPSNPMVEEKRSKDPTKSEYDLRMEAHANEVVHDTSGLVYKDTKKVEPVWNKSQPSYWSRLFGSKPAETLDDVSTKAEDVKQTVQDTSSQAKSIYEAAKDEKENLKQEVGEYIKHQKDNLNEIHKQVSENAQEWKNQEKSWYQKGTEQVKTGFYIAKDVLEGPKDIQSRVPARSVVEHARGSDM